MNVALYVRVSTLDQNTEAQRRELETYANRHGWDIAGVFEDRASGTDPGRPALARLLQECRAGRIDTVLCWKLDRFGRSLPDCLRTLEVLESELVRFIAVSQGLDFHRSNPASRLLLHVLGAAAEFERELIRERCSSGMVRYQQDLDAGRVGKTVHSQSRKDLPAHRPRKILDVEKIQELRRQGLPVAVLAERFATSKATIERRLKEAKAPGKTPSPPSIGLGGAVAGSSQDAAERGRGLD